MFPFSLFSKLLTPGLDRYGTGYILYSVGQRDSNLWMVMTTGPELPSDTDMKRSGSRRNLSCYAAYSSEALLELLLSSNSSRLAPLRPMYFESRTRRYWMRRRTLRLLPSISVFVLSQHLSSAYHVLNKETSFLGWDNIEHTQLLVKAVSNCWDLFSWFSSKTDVDNGLETSSTKTVRDMSWWRKPWWR